MTMCINESKYRQAMVLLADISANWDEGDVWQYRLPKSFDELVAELQDGIVWNQDVRRFQYQPIEFPTWLEKLGAVDSSYGNDQMAHAHVWIETNRIGVSVWVNDEACFLAKECRFIVVAIRTEEEWLRDSGQVLYEGDSGIEAKAAIEKALVILKQEQAQ